MPVASFDVEEVPEGPLLGVVGARRVAGGGADAAVLLLDQVVVAEVLVPAEAPVAAGLLVEHLGEGLGQAVGEGLGHDRVVVVVVGLEPLRQLLGAEAGRDGEGAEVVGDARADRGEVVGQAAERWSGPRASTAGGGRGTASAPTVRDSSVQTTIVVAVGVGREEAVDGVRPGSSRSATIRSSSVRASS